MCIRDRFDYASYSYFATTIALVFFPTDNHTVAMLQTFGVFALSFILRPIGALFWGSYGDKKGRKAALAHSIMFMSGASFLIGCLPSYSVIGVGAPILLLLLRMVQGFSASGEYAGAATFLGEYAPTSKRGIYCSLIPASTAIGLLAGSTLATLMTANMNSSAMVGWGSVSYTHLDVYKRQPQAVLRGAVRRDRKGSSGHLQHAAAGAR